MNTQTLNIQFCGFGGQGVVLAAVIFGTTAVTKSGLEACQTQSYGSEARGGECQAQVIVSGRPINSPLCEYSDLLVGMSNQALQKYLPHLRKGGTVVYNVGLASVAESDSYTAIGLPATEIAAGQGTALAANMVVLGFLQAATRLFSEEDLLEVVSGNVPSRFLQANLSAARQGMYFARENGINIEV